MKGLRGSSPGNVVVLHVFDLLLVIQANASRDEPEVNFCILPLILRQIILEDQFSTFRCFSASIGINIPGINICHRYEGPRQIPGFGIDHFRLEIRRQVIGKSPIFRNLAAITIIVKYDTLINTGNRVHLMIFVVKQFSDLKKIVLFAVASCIDFILFFKRSRKDRFRCFFRGGSKGRC